MSTSTSSRVAEKWIGLGWRGFLFRIQPGDELDQPALVVEHLGPRRIVAFVGEADAQAAVEEGQLAQPVSEGIPRKFEGGEDLRVRLERDRRSGSGRHADYRELLGGLPAHERHLVPGPGQIDRDGQLFGKRIDDGNADAVQAAGHLVGVAVELSAGVQHRERQFDAGHLLSGVDVHRNAATVIDHRDRVVLVNRDIDAVGETGERLIDRVVDHLVHEVMQAVLSRRPDVHGGTLAHRLESLEDGDAVRAVVVVLIGVAGVLRHASSRSRSFRVGRAGRPTSECAALCRAVTR